MVYLDICKKNRIGEGSVYKRKLRGDIEDQGVAIKVIDCSKEQKELTFGKCMAFRECLNLRMLSVKPESLRMYVVDFYGGYETVSSTVNSLHIVMELCDGNLDLIINKEMLFRISRTKDTQNEGIGYVLQLAEQAAMGIQFLHDNNVVHKDIKPQNFLIKYVKEDTQVKICDFDRSRKPNCDGTVPYNAFEVLAGFARDIYSFGLVIWQLWYDEKVTEAEIGDPRKKASPLNVNKPQKDLKKLMLSMWTDDQTKRPDAASVVYKLNQLVKQYKRKRPISVET